MFIMTLIRFGISFFLKPGFLGHEFLGVVKMSLHCLFSASQKHMGSLMSLESEDFFSKMFWSGI